MLTIDLKTYRPAPIFVTTRIEGECYEPVVHYPPRRLDARMPGRIQFRGPANTACIIGLYVEGHGTLSLDGRRESFASNTLVLVNPMEAYDLLYSASSETVLVTTMFSWRDDTGQDVPIRFAAALSGWAGEPVPEKSSVLPLEAAAAQRVRDIMEELARQYLPAERLHWYNANRALMKLFDALLSYVYFEPAPGTSSTAVWLEPVRMLIENRFADDLTLDSLASAAGVTSQHLCREFGRYYHVTPLAYQQQLRLRQAVILLETTALRIGDVAEQCGYRCQFHFSRMFRQRYGVSPRAFRLRQSGA